MDVREMVEEMLDSLGCDALYNDCGCACKLGDLMPCDGPQAGCEAARVRYCKDCDERDDSEVCSDNWPDGWCAHYVDVERLVGVS